MFPRLPLLCRPRLALYLLCALALGLVLLPGAPGRGLDLGTVVLLEGRAD